MKHLTFEVVGNAKPAGSKRPVRAGGTGRILLVDSSGKDGKAWRDAVAHAAAAAMLEARETELFDGPLTLSLIFRRPRPKGHFGSGKNAGKLRENAPPYPTTRPDVLKLARSVEDAMSGVVYRDDSQIVDEHLHKVYGIPAGVRVVVTEVPF